MCVDGALRDRADAERARDGVRRAVVAVARGLPRWLVEVAEIIVFQQVFAEIERIGDFSCSGVIYHIFIGVLRLLCVERIAVSSESEVILADRAAEVDGDFSDILVRTRRIIVLLDDCRTVIALRDIFEIEQEVAFIDAAPVDDAAARHRIRRLAVAARHRITFKRVQIAVGASVDQPVVYSIRARELDAAVCHILALTRCIIRIGVLFLVIAIVLGRIARTSLRLVDLVERHIVKHACGIHIVLARGRFMLLGRSQQQLALSGRHIRIAVVRTAHIRRRRDEEIRLRDRAAAGERMRRIHLLPLVRTLRMIEHVVRRRYA